MCPKAAGSDGNVPCRMQDLVTFKDLGRQMSKQKELPPMNDILSSIRLILGEQDGVENGGKEQVRSLDDLAKLDPQSIQSIIGVVGINLLSIALKSAPQPIIDAFHANLSARTRKLLREETSYSTQATEDEMVDAQNYMLKVAIELSMRGEIVLPK